MGLHDDIRKRCEAVAETVPIPDPFDVDTLVAALSERRRRPIRLLPFPLPPSAPCGLCVSTDRVDYVIVTDTAAGRGLVHEQVVLHELSHLLLDHQVNIIDDPDAGGWLLPHLDSEVVKRVLARRRYNTVEEQEAETLGTLLRQRAGPWRASAPGTSADPLVRRLGHSLEHGTRHGWPGHCG